MDKDKKWHPVNNGVPYKYLSNRQREEIAIEYPFLIDCHQYEWVRDADTIEILDYSI